MLNNNVKNRSTLFRWTPLTFRLLCGCYTKLVFGITVLVLSINAFCQPSMEYDGEYFFYKFSGLDSAIEVFNKTMDENQAAVFLGIVEENKTLYEKFWSLIPRADGFAIQTECMNSCYAVAKLQIFCEGIYFVSFGPIESQNYSGLNFVTSGMQMIEHCDTFLAKKPWWKFW
ncbi:hypothetical protein [Teredinibacter sp. KSP-S5-2]|uniref:hypothetical protein n=1 Tax=Teredinibacter sp. KSP-S5-2 TaxID=3034506 RepID=UPI002934BF5F|nr:hypothetical protein [Teredinibacter sp. KSP-S5-2]WNO09524.1 hypothetical protein P5V12_21535 [Teredinibacter sp. KSP-S5-2]